jgi:hypothetical protein
MKTDSAQKKMSINTNTILSGKKILAQAFTLSKEMRFEDAAEVVTNAYWNNPKLTDGFAQIAWDIRNLQPKKLKDAKEYFEKDIALNKLSPAWRINYAQILAELELIQEAQHQVEISYIQSNTVKEGYSRIGWALRNKNIGLAIAYFNKDIALQKISPRGRLDYAEVLSKNGDLPAAKQSVESAYKLNNSLQDGFFRIGLGYYSQNYQWGKIRQLVLKDKKLNRCSAHGHNVIAKIDECISIKQKLTQIKCNQQKTRTCVVIQTVKIQENPMHRDLYLAFVLASNGADVMVLLDDYVLEHWDTAHYAYNQPYTQKKHIYNSLLEKLLLWTYSHQNIKIIFYSSIVNNNRMLNCEPDDILHAESSVRRYFKNGIFDFNNPLHKDYYKSSIVNCQITKTVSQYIIGKYLPDIFIASHGIYSIYGPSWQAMKNHNIETYSFCPTSKAKQGVIISDQIVQLIADSSDWTEYKTQNSITDNIKLEVKNYFQDRFSFKSNDTKAIFEKNKHSDLPVLKKNNNFIYGLFPNVIWDGDIAQRNTIFSSMIDWIVFTINVFKQKQDVLVIRPHPAQFYFYHNNQGLYDIIIKFIPELNELKNVVFFSEQMNFNTYKFINNIDIGITYSGSLTVELPYLGIPGIACGKGRHPKGVAFEPKDMKEYHEILMDSKVVFDYLKNNQLKIQDQIYLYIYWLKNKSIYQFPILDKDIHHSINYQSLSVADIDPQSNPELLKTVDRILSVSQKSF